MKLGLLSLFLLVPLSAAAAQTTGTDHSILTTWVQPSGYVSCSGTVLKACILGYTEKLADPSGLVTTIPSCSATLLTGCIAQVSTYLWTPGGALFCGNWTITLATNYLDGNGSPGVSSPSTAVSVVEPCPFVPPGAPSGASVKTQP